MPMFDEVKALWLAVSIMERWVKEGYARDDATVIEVNDAVDVLCHMLTERGETLQFEFKR